MLKTVWRIILIVFGLAVVFLAVNFFVARKAALDRFAFYEAIAKSVDTTFGRISFIDSAEIICIMN